MLQSQVHFYTPGRRHRNDQKAQAMLRSHVHPRSSSLPLAEGIAMFKKHKQCYRARSTSLALAGGIAMLKMHKKCYSATCTLGPALYPWLKVS